MKNKVLLFLFMLFIANVVNAETFIIDGKRNVKIERNDDGVLSFFKNDKKFLSGFDFTIDGYSMFNTITGTGDGFILNLIGNNFGARFDIYLKNTKDGFYITKSVSSITYTESDTNIKISCEKKFNIRYKDSDRESLGVLLYSLRDNDFNKYCYSTRWTPNY